MTHFRTAVPLVLTSTVTLASEVVRHLFAALVIQVSSFDFNPRY